MSASKPRFTNSLNSLLSARAQTDLLAFHDALTVLVHAERKAYRPLKSKHDNPACLPVLARLVPLQRNLDKLLHQRRSVANFRQVLADLAHTLLDDLLSWPHALENTPADTLPLSRLLLEETFRYQTAAQVQRFRNLLRGRDLLYIVERLAGDTLGGLRASLKAEVQLEKDSKRERLQTVLRAVQEALPASDYEFLVQHVRAA